MLRSQIDQLGPKWLEFLGMGTGERRKGELFLFVLPVVISLAFFLIADLDSPRGGAIRVHPQNLLAVALSIKPP